MEKLIALGINLAFCQLRGFAGETSPSRILAGNFNSDIYLTVRDFGKNTRQKLKHVQTAKRKRTASVTHTCNKVIAFLSICNVFTYLKVEFFNFSKLVL